MKLVNTAQKPVNINFSIDGRKMAEGEIYAQVLKAGLDDYNHIGKEETVKPIDRKQKLSGKINVLNLEAHSFTVLHLPFIK